MKLPVLHTENLLIGYRGKPLATNPANLKLSENNLAVMVGVNGVGKSTLLRSLAGLQDIISGSVHINRKVLHELSAREKATQISVVLTERMLPGNITVIDLVALGRYPYTGWNGKLRAEDEAAVAQAVTVTGCESFAHQKVAELSDGQRQRAMIARALAQDTAVILLDEPTAHLDLPGRWQTFRLLRELTRKQGKSILVASHQLDLALRFADEIWLLQADGKTTQAVPEDLVLNGDLARVFEREGLRFDQDSGGLLPEVEGDRTAQVTGVSPAVYWTANALRREGYQIVTNDTADLTVDVEATPDGYCWKAVANGQSITADSVGGFLEALQNLS